MRNLNDILNTAIYAGGVFGGTDVAPAPVAPPNPAAAGLPPTPPVDSTKPPAVPTAAAPAPVGGATTLGTTGAPQPTNTTETPKDGGPAASVLGSVKVDKPADGAKPAEKPAESKPFEIKVPEGVQVDAAVLKDFTAIAQKAGLSGEAASELVAWEAKRTAAEMEKWNKTPLADRLGAVLEQQEPVWEKELRADKEFGGQRFDDTVKLAHRALTRFPGGVELAHELDSMGFGFYPPLVKWLATIGQGLKEDTSHIPGASAAGKATARERAMERYPNSPELWPK